MTTETLFPKIAEVKGQTTWLDGDLPDLRTMARELRTQAIGKVTVATTLEGAIEVAASPWDASVQAVYAFVKANKKGY